MPNDYCTGCGDEVSEAALSRVYLGGFVDDSGKVCDSCLANAAVEAGLLDEDDPVADADGFEPATG